MDNFEASKKTCVALIESRLEQVMILKPHPAQIREAMKYSLLGGGKRMRPLCLVWAAHKGETPSDITIDFACALEMIHTYSLIHDDLPSMDNDDMRRGRPTNHIVHGEAMAVLAGDGLLNLAYETMINSCLSHRKPAGALKAISEIASAAGTSGMIGGQVLDILAVDAPSTQELYKMYRMKTAALIRASVVAGAMLAGESDEALEKYRSAGEALGLAFQIMDDILDVAGDEAVLGKPIGSDERNKKHTYVSISGMEEAKKLHEQLCEEAIQAFQSLGSEFLCEYTNQLRDRIN